MIEEKIHDITYFFFLIMISVGHIFYIISPRLQIVRLFVICLPLYFFITNFTVLKRNIPRKIMFFFNAYLLYTFWVTVFVQKPVLNSFVNFIILILFANYFLFMSSRSLEKSIILFFKFSNLFLISIFILALIEIIWGVHLPVSRYYELKEKVNIPTGIYFNENDFATIYFVIFFFRICIKIEFLEEKVNLFDLFLLLCCLVISYTTQSRLTMLALALIIVFYFFSFFNIAIKYLLLGCFCFALVQNFTALLNFLKVFFSDKGSNEIRLNLILSGLQSVSEYGNFWGYGIDQSDYFYRSILRTELFLGGIVNPHAFLIEILLNSGIIFFICFLLLSIGLFIWFYNQKKILFSLFSLLYFFILMGSSSSLFLLPHYVCFFLLFIVKKKYDFVIQKL